MNAPSDEDQPSLREEAIQAIRAAVVYGTLPPGRLHSASALATQMKMLATPVREAIQHVAGRGMIKLVRNRGVVVAQPSREQLEVALRRGADDRSWRFGRRGHHATARSRR